MSAPDLIKTKQTEKIHCSKSVQEIHVSIRPSEAKIGEHKGSKHCVQRVPKPV
jgi:hypothetical protein